MDVSDVPHLYKPGEVLCAVDEPVSTKGKRQECVLGKTMASVCH